MESNRTDIYYCPNCGYFFDRETGNLFDIAYTEMPAEFAIQVMSDRSIRFRVCHLKATAVLIPIKYSFRI
jgi:hypothetical protein